MKKSIAAAVFAVIISSNAVFADGLKDMNGHWAEETVEKLIELKLINGYEDGTFRPENKITREEAATIVSKALNNGKNMYKPSSAIFKDVVNTYSASYIDDLANREIISGYDDGTFRPKTYISREEYAVIIYRLARNEGKLTLSKKESPKDINDCSDWSKSAIKILTGNGMIKGFGDGTFRPKEQITRAEAVKMLYEAVYRKGYIPPKKDNDYNNIKDEEQTDSLYTQRTTYLRMNADDVSEIIGKNGILSTGTEVLVEGELDDYYLAKPSGIPDAFRGYAPKENFGKTKPEFKEVNLGIKILKEDTILLKEADSESEPTARNSVLSKGANLEVKGEYGDYYLIKPYHIPNADEGYVLKSIVE